MPHIKVRDPRLRAHKRRPDRHLDALVPKRRVLRPHPLLNPPLGALARVDLVPRRAPHPLEQRAGLDARDRELLRQRRELRRQRGDGPRVRERRQARESLRRRAQRRRERDELRAERGRRAGKERERRGVAERARGDDLVAEREE